MIDNDDNGFGKTVRRILDRRSGQTTRDDCPNEENLAAYLTGASLDQERDRLEQHLAACAYCLTEVAAANDAGETGVSANVPRWLMERAMGVVAAPKGENVFDLVVRFVKDAVELARQSGEWIVIMAPQPAAVRGAAATGASSMLQLERAMDDHKIELEVERVESNLGRVVVRVKSADGKPADGLRVSLTAGGREQASFLIRQGQAVFDGVPQGDYQLVISRAASTVGTINLKIEA